MTIYCAPTLEFAAAQPVPESVGVRLEDIRQPTSSGPPPPSGMQSLIELARSTAPVDYVRIDLREGSSWLTSRLYVFAVVLPPVLGLRCFVFVCSRGEIPRYCLGLSSPEAVRTDLEARYPWLRNAIAEVQLLQLLYGQTPNRSPAWYPDQKMQDALKALSDASPGPKFEWKTRHSEALQRIVQSLVSPIDLSQNGQVETFVQRFLQNPILRRPHQELPPTQTGFNLATWMSTRTGSRTNANYSTCWGTIYCDNTSFWTEQPPTAAT